MGAGPNFPAFAPDGTLYVTDIEQALIWRVPRGGGRPEVFFTDARLENVFGPNGIQVTDGGRTLAFVVTAQSPSAGNPTQGRLFRLPIADGRPGELQSVWESRPVDGPDGFALGRSGNAYIALAGSSQLVVVSPAGEELARIPGPASPQPDPPFDAPASAAFDGERLLVTNQSFPAGNPDHWAVFDIFAGEPGEPLHRPRITGGGGTTPIASARLHLTFNHGPRDCAVGRIRATVRGAGITRVTFRLDRRARRVDRAEPFRRIVYRPRRGQRPRRHTVTARVVSQAGARTLTRRVRTCRRR
jgi:hypothetical protein